MANKNTKKYNNRIVIESSGSIYYTCDLSEINFVSEDPSHAPKRQIAKG